MYLSLPRTKTLAVLVTAAAASVVFAGSPTQAGASCAPVAHTPSVSGGTGIASADLPCSGSYTIRLVNNAGSTLGSASGTGSGHIQTPSTVCAGAIVHTFVTVNVGGTNLSDTSGTIQC
jgi:hypothetical protein